MDNKTKNIKQLLKPVNFEGNHSARPTDTNANTFSHGLLPRPSSFQKSRGNKSQIFSKGKVVKKNTDADKKIKQQNIRLLCKLIQIKHKKSKFEQLSQSTIKRRRQNPERQRSITLQNKRLGSSIVRIRSGKNIQRVKTQISDRVQRMLRKKMGAREKTDYNLFAQERKTIFNIDQLPTKSAKKVKH